MKSFILGAFLALSLPSNALADVFQLRRQATGEPASEAAVSFKGQLIAYTDNYGRIEISKSPGTYTFDISFRGQRTPVILTLTGNPQLQVINF
jgi:hypothetical protein